MSYSATNARVEGVLTSIRDIVGARSPEPPAAGANFDGRDRQVNGLHAGVPPSADLLVLTQNYRVSEPELLTLTPEQQVVSDGTGDSGPSAPKSAHQSSREVEDLIAKIAALETAIADTVDQWEPDDTGRGPYAGTASPVMAWPAPETRATPRPEVAAPAESDRADPAEDVAEEQVVDEAVLRALVAEIVREELQGELGQRLSRNVRKVIRQEVQRALAAQALT
jgi:hypothetical protein